MRILIIDGMNLFIRNFVVVPTMDSNGNSIGGLTGFLKGLKGMLSESKADKVIVAWDGEGGSRHRRGIFAEYKAGRKVRLNRPAELESQDESFGNMSIQMKKLKNLLSLIGTLQVETPEVEADDVIALLCKFIFVDDEKVVLTSDRDMLQLVDKKTIVYSPTKKIYYTRSEMLERMGVLPENYIYIKAFMGDGSDNVKGIGGVGEKTALKLFPFLAEKPVEISEIRLHAEANKDTGSKYQSIIDHWDQFLENIKLMQLSSPNLSPQAVRTIRTSSTEVRPKFMLTEFKLQLVRDGIQSLDTDFFGVIQGYKIRCEACA